MPWRRRQNVYGARKVVAVAAFVFVVVVVYYFKANRTWNSGGDGNGETAIARPPDKRLGIPKDTVVYRNLSKYHTQSDDLEVVWLDGEPWTMEDIRQKLLARTAKEDDVAEFPAPARALAGDVAPTAANRTRDGTGLLVYNRVPKCGSTTMQAILARLAKRNGFRHHSSKDYSHKQLNAQEQLDFLRDLESRPEAFYSVDRHVYFVDGNQFAMEPPPNWINLLRDPVERYASAFNFIRHPKWWTKKKGKKAKSRPSAAWFSKDISKCVLSGDVECRVLPGAHKEQQLTYFCGSDPACLVVGSDEALQRAKRNAEENFAVVGVVEDLSSTLSVLEAYLPRFFSGGLSVYNKELKSVHKNKSQRGSAGTLSPEAAAVVSRTLGGDAEFYRFAQQRLHEQLRNVMAK